MAAGVPEGAAVSLRRLVSQCVDLAERAGALIREVSENASTPGGVRAGLVDKGKQGTFDPQTVADRLAQRCIVDNLRAVYQRRLRIIGEEGELEESSEDGAIELREPNDVLLNDAWPLELDSQIPLAELCVWVDPLDGTREYTEGRFEYVSTLVGISRKGRPIAGVISEPYGQVPGQGAGRILWGCCVGPNGAEQAACPGVHVLQEPSWSRPQRPPGRCLVVVSRSRADGAVAEALARLTSPQSSGAPPLVTGTFAAGGAGHKVARVVDGAADLWLFPRPGTSRWDSCAAEAMLSACGGALRNALGELIIYDPDGDTRNMQGILAGADLQVVEEAARACVSLVHRDSS